MDVSQFDRLARMLGALRSRRAATALLGGLIATPILSHGNAEAKPKKQRKKRRKPGGGAKACRQRCSKHKSKQARRRCRRRCQDTTPGPDTCPTDGTEVVVTSYAEVADGYAQGSALALPAGPDAVANFVNERFTDLRDQLSPELRDLVSLEYLANFSYFLQHNRLRFEVPSEIGTFDGYFEGDYIEGYFTQLFTLSFWLIGTDPIPPGSVRPLEGRWEGQIYDPTGAFYPAPFDIVVTFATVSGELTGTLDVAGVVQNVPITDISFSESRPLSTEPSGNVRIIPAPHWTQYAALVGWGSYAMAFSFFIDAQGQVIGFDIAPDWPIPPDVAAGIPIETVMRLPMDGVWWISSGGPRQYENHHATDPASRHALDFGVWNERGSYEPNPEENADYWAWEQPLFAPAAGTVVDMANDVPDNDFGSIDTTTPGNMIVLQTAPQEFLLMAHFRQGSVAVTLGEQVQEGQFLARIGNSGFSSGPHLHMQLIDRMPYPFDPETVCLPFRFKDLLVNGKPKVNPSLVLGDFVQHAGCPTPVPAELAPQAERERPNRPNRKARDHTERPTMTQSRTDWFRSPAAVPMDGPPAMPWDDR